MDKGSFILHRAVVARQSCDSCVINNQHLNTKITIGFLQHFYSNYIFLKHTIASENRVTLSDSRVVIAC